MTNEEVTGSNVTSEEHCPLNITKHNKDANDECFVICNELKEKYLPLLYIIFLIVLMFFRVLTSTQDLKVKTEERITASTICLYSPHKIFSSAVFLFSLKTSVWKITFPTHNISLVSMSPGPV